MSENIQKELHQLGNGVLDTQNGKRFIALLEKLYILDSAVAPHFEKPSYCYYREGENNIVRLLRQMIEIKPEEEIL
jgi:hypothetical protein